jgi:hypothetical protein
VREAESQFAGDQTALLAVAAVLALLDRHGGGGVVSAEEWKAAALGAGAFRSVAVARAAWGAADAAAGWGEAWETHATAEVAAEGRAAAADRITHAVLTELERALGVTPPPS